MKVEFDTANAAELLAVSALIASLRGDAAPLAVAGADTVAAPAISTPPPTLAPAVVSTTGATDAATESTVSVPLPPASVVVPPPPVTVIAPPAPSQGAVETDADGLPWDKRIHSTPASKKQDGKWRGKRGLDDTTRAAVTAELRGALAAPVAIPLPPSEPVADAATAFAAPVVAPAIEPAAVVPPPPPVADVAVADFAGLMRKITGLQQAGALDVTGTMQIAQSLGLTGVRDLMVRPDLIASFDALLPAAG